MNANHGRLLLGIAVILALIAIVCRSDIVRDEMFSRDVRNACESGEPFQLPTPYGVSWDRCRVIWWLMDDSACILEFQENGATVASIEVSRSAADFFSNAPDEGFDKADAIFRGVKDKSGWIYVKWVGREKDAKRPTQRQTLRVD